MLLSTAVQSTAPFTPWGPQGVHPWEVGQKPLQTQAGAAPKGGEHWFHHTGTQGQGPFSNYW